MKKLTNIIFLIFLIVYGFTNLNFANKIIKIKKMEVPPKIDGQIEKNEWQNTTKLDKFYQTEPGNNSEPSEKTRGFLGYTDKKLYILTKGFVKDKDDLRAFHNERDNISKSDRIFLYFDTFKNRSKAYFFGANVFGEQSDGIFKNHSYKTSIDLNYQSKGRITSYGYLIEFAIPFESIKYQSGKNITWNFFMQRRIPAKNEEIACFKVDRSKSNFFANYEKIQFDKLPKQKNLSLIPAYTGHFDISYDKDNEKTENYYDKKELNVFYEPNSNFSLKFVLNPDFSFIESDALKIDVNSRYSTYYEEKRPFFIEKNITYDPPINIFYTRTIYEPKAGLKFSGSNNNFKTYSLLSYSENVNSDKYFNNYNESQSIVDDTYYGFFSVSKNLGQNLNIRSSMTYRQFSDLTNSVFSIDGKFRKNNITLESQIVTSYDEKLNSKKEQGYGYYSNFDYELENLDFELSVLSLDENFKPDMGYITDVDKSQINNELRYIYHSETDKQLVRFFSTGLTQYYKYDYSYNSLNEWKFEPYIEMSLNDIWFQINREEQMYRYNNKRYRTSQNEYRTNLEILKFINLYLEIKRGTELYFSSDSFVDDYLEIESSLNLSPFEFLMIDYDYNYQDLDNAYTANINQIKTKFQFVSRLWFRIIFQRKYYEIHSERRTVTNYNIYPLLTYNLNANTAIYLGCNDIKNETEEMSNTILDEKKLNYFFKIKYNFDII